jgi:hypothetical protein
MFQMRKQTHTLADVPQMELYKMAVKQYFLGALAWDYADTVNDLAASMRLDGTKKISRAVNNLRREYNSVRSLDLDAKHRDKEWELAQLFESINKQHLSRLYTSLCNEIRRDHTKLTDEYVTLVASTYVALTVLDTVMLFARQCDRYIEIYYPEAPHSILPDHFVQLAKLLPLFAGDIYNPNMQARTLTAKILLNEVNRIELFDEDGKQ